MSIAVVCILYSGIKKNHFRGDTGEWRAQYNFELVVSSIIEIVRIIFMLFLVLCNVPLEWTCWTFRRIDLYWWIKYDLGQKYYAPQVRPDWGSNSWPPDHDSTFHITEMPALTTWPSMISPDLQSWMIAKIEESVVCSLIWMISSVTIFKTIILS